MAYLHDFRVEKELRSQGIGRWALGEVLKHKDEYSDVSFGDQTWLDAWPRLTSTRNCLLTTGRPIHLHFPVCGQLGMASANLVERTRPCCRGEGRRDRILVGFYRRVSYFLPLRRAARRAPSLTISIDRTARLPPCRDYCVLLLRAFALASVSRRPRGPRRRRGESGGPARGDGPYDGAHHDDAEPPESPLKRKCEAGGDDDAWLRRSERGLCMNHVFPCLFAICTFTQPVAPLTGCLHNVTRSRTA